MWLRAKIKVNLNPELKKESFLREREPDGMGPVNENYCKKFI